MNLSYYSIHTTRNCNINCAHCLCGEPQNIDIKENVVKAAFDGIDSIYKLYITGGEVLLKPQLIKMVASEVKKRNIQVERLAITTNATLLNDEAKEALLYAYEIPDYGYDRILEVSIDKFHKKAVEQYIIKNNMQNILSFDKIIDNAKQFCDDNNIKLILRDIKNGTIEKLGRARNIKGAVETDISFQAVSNYEPGMNSFKPAFEDVVSIDPTGEVIKCDFENDNIENASIGNVLLKPLEQIIYERCIVELKEQKMEGIDFSDEESIKNALSMACRKKYSINNFIAF